MREKAVDEQKPPQSNSCSPPHSNPGPVAMTTEGRQGRAWSTPQASRRPPRWLTLAQTPQNQRRAAEVPPFEPRAPPLLLAARGRKQDSRDAGRISSSSGCPLSAESPLEDSGEDPRLPSRTFLQSYVRLRFGPVWLASVSPSVVCGFTAPTPEAKVYS